MSSAGLKDVVNYFLPIPPTVLKRDGDFPDCIEIFENLSKNPPSPRHIGRLFLSICRLTGLAWLVWLFSFLCFTIGVIILIVFWGNDIDMSKPIFFNVLTCKMVISILATSVVISKIMFSALTMISFTICERCYEVCNVRK